jgi:hypothetical protein
MFTIIIGAIVNLLIWWFEQWWKNKHPAQPGPKEKQAFLTEVSRFKHFWMGPNRHKYAAALFDKFAAKYQANPPVVELSDAPLSAKEAAGFANKYAKGLTLTSDEVK